jgi:hypothetical protein
MYSYGYARFNMYVFIWVSSLYYALRTLLSFLLLRWVPRPFVPKVCLEPARPTMPARI